MSALAKRVYNELQVAMAENAVLRHDAASMDHRLSLAYREGLERGSAQLEEARVLADNRLTEIIGLLVEWHRDKETIQGLRDQLSELRSPTLNWLSSAGLDFQDRNQGVVNG